MLKNVTILLFLLLTAAASMSAKDIPSQVITWPQTGSPIVRISLGKAKELSSISSQRNYVIETTAENLWDKKIPRMGFNLYIYDKNKVRIGDAWITLENVTPGQTVKFETTIHTVGVPVSFELIPNSLPAELQPLAPPRKITITVNSVPQGANLSVDGEPAGTTPKLVQLAVGKHSLEFTKEGFNHGKFPVEIGPDDASGGSVSYELGSAAHDTIELRDGSVTSGDLVSVSGMQVQIRIGGNTQTFDRNQIKRISLTERDPAN
ncbi:MAG TPA: PEGA domain-containing protein [Terriglobales bacterium]|nr:PEGA domain-containing protein [Terriglobales bacterium]